MNQIFVIATLIFMLVQYFKGPSVPSNAKLGDKLLGAEIPSCAQESAIGNERERRIRNSSGKKKKSKKSGGEQKKGEEDNEDEDDTFDKV